MSANKLNLGQFIHWDWGQNYPFGACMAKLMECLGVGQWQIFGAHGFKKDYSVNT